MRILIGAVLAVAILGGPISEVSARTVEVKRAILQCNDWRAKMAKEGEYTMTLLYKLDEEYHSTGALSHYQASIVRSVVQTVINEAFFSMRKITNWNPNVPKCKRTAEHFIERIHNTAIVGICGFEPRYCPNGINANK